MFDSHNIPPPPITSFSFTRSKLNSCTKAAKRLSSTPENQSSTSEKNPVVPPQSPADGSPRDPVYNHITARVIYLTSLWGNRVFRLFFRFVFDTVVVVETDRDSEQADGRTDDFPGLVCVCRRRFTRSVPRWLNRCTRPTAGASAPSLAFVFCFFLHVPVVLSNLPLTPDSEKTSLFILNVGVRLNKVAEFSSRRKSETDGIQLLSTILTISRISWR